MNDRRVIARGLGFPEGPVAMADSSVVLVEIERQTVTRVFPDGRTAVLARTGGGPNGLALGPDGAFYVCNNGGFAWRLEAGLLRPVAQASDYAGGRIERVDPADGSVRLLYDRCGGHALRGPNDLVFDLTGPGVARKAPFPSPHGGRLVAGLAGFQRFDSLAVDAAGNICVATLVSGAITVFAPDGTVLRQVPMGDPMTTNICFDGPERRTAFITLSGRGELVAMDWPGPGLALAYEA